MNSLRVLQLSSSSQLSMRRITPGDNQTAVLFLFSSDISAASNQKFLEEWLRVGYNRDTK